MIFFALLVLLATSACFAKPAANTSTVCVTVCENTTWPHFRYSSSRAVATSTIVDTKNGSTGTGKRRAFVAPTSCGSCCTLAPHDDKHTQFNNTTNNKENTRSNRNESNNQGSDPATATSTLGYVATALTFAFAYVLKSTSFGSLFTNTSFRFSDMWGIVAVALFVQSILNCCNNRRRNPTLDDSHQGRVEIHLHQTINVHHIREWAEGEANAAHDGAQSQPDAAERASAKEKEKCLVLVKTGEVSTMANSD